MLRFGRTTGLPTERYPDSSILVRKAMGPLAWVLAWVTARFTATRRTSSSAFSSTVEHPRRCGNISTAASSWLRHGKRATRSLPRLGSLRPSEIPERFSASALPPSRMVRAHRGQPRPAHRRAARASAHRHLPPHRGQAALAAAQQRDGRQTQQPANRTPRPRRSPPTGDCYSSSES